LGFNREKELLVGQLARRQLVLNPRNTFANLKRYVGRRWDELEEGSLAVPYTIRANDQGNVRVVCPATEREYAPEELVASLLRKLVDDAATYLGEPVEAAVITVPAYFNDAQRQATRDAGRLAGISVERILNEPTAAALAYGFDRSAVKRVLVFDLGGGTFDVSVLRIANGVFDVKATSGDTQLGGNDWDRRIVDWLAEAFLAQHQIDLRRDRQALQRLTEAAEKAKQELSGCKARRFPCPSSPPPKPVRSTSKPPWSAAPLRASAVTCSIACCGRSNGPCAIPAWLPRTSTMWCWWVAAPACRWCRRWCAPSCPWSPASRSTPMRWWRSALRCRRASSPANCAT
jgi:molecular chaperone DnaK (HSP70)